MTPEELAILIARIAAGQATLDDFARAIGAVEAIMMEAKRVQAALDAALLAHVQMRDAITIGVTVYYAGYKTATTAKDKLAVFEALLVHTGGDLGTATAYLIAQPYKDGSIRKLLPPALFSSLFTSKQDTRLGKRLMKADTRFCHHSAEPRALDNEPHDTL